MNTLFSPQIQQVIISYLTPSIVWYFFLAIIGIALLLSIIVLWHWQKHGVGVLRKAGVEIIYIIVTGAFVVAFFITITSLISNL